MAQSDKFHATPDPKGFTLIELLVVIAIIVLLVSILVPSLKQAKEFALQMKCMSNLKAQGSAVHIYSTEYDSKMPYRAGGAGWDGTGLMGSSYEWLIAPYAGTREDDLPTFRPLYEGGSGKTDNIDNPLFWCPAGPVIGKRPGYYLQCRNGVFTNSGGYEGAFYYHWSSTYDRSRPDHSSSNPENWSAISKLNLSSWSHPGQTPYKFCSDRANFMGVANANSVVGAGSGLQGGSWHMRSKDWSRPALFVDGHVKTLVDPNYTTGGNYEPLDPDTEAPYRKQQLISGPYSSYFLGTGGGRPEHSAWDYWIDEY